MRSIGTWRGLRLKLILVNAAVVTAVLVSAYISQAHLVRAEKAAEELSLRSIQAIDLAAQLETLMHEKSYVSNYLLSKDPTYLAQAQEHYQGLGRWIEGMSAFAADSQQTLIVEEMRQSYMRYTRAGDQVVALEKLQRRAQALTAFFAMKREVEALLAGGQKLFDMEIGAMRATREQAALSIARQRRIMLALIGFGSALSVLMAVFLTGHTVRPIYRLVLRLGETETQTDADAAVVEADDELRFLEARVSALIERVRAQERKLARTAKLTQIGELSAELAHEILNPVAGVKAMLQALRRTPEEPARLLAELDAMERDLGRVETTIRRLMRYARPFEPNLRQVSVAQLLAVTREHLRHHPAAVGHRISFAVGGDGGAPLGEGVAWLMDVDLVSQVLVNLIVNACEASEVGQDVEVVVTHAGGRLHLGVHDQGSGFSEETRARLFHPFFTTKPDGHGLGLALSRNIIQEHGGDIRASSPRGRGATFEVTLPGGMA